MGSTFNDRVDGVSTTQAVKAPVLVASVANLTLSGEQTVNSVAVAAGNRVLVKDQTDATENGIYVVSTTAWSRSSDFDGTRDVKQGTLVWDVNASVFYNVQTVDPIVIGTSNITFDIPTVSVTTATQEFTASSSQTVFTLTTMTYVPGINAVSVYVDGVKLATSEYTETSSTVITLDTGLSGGELVEIISNERPVTGTTIDATSVSFNPQSGTVTNVADHINGTIKNTIAQLTAISKTVLSNGYQVHVGGYSAQGDGGGGDFYWDSSSTATENLVTIFEADAAGTGRWIRIVNDTLLRPIMAGAPSGGVTNATTQIAAMLAAGDSIIDGLYAVSGVTTTNYLTMLPDARLVYIGAQNGTCLTLGVDFGDIYIDGDLEDCVGATLDTDGVTGKSIYVERITASATSSTSIYPVRVNADNCTVDTVSTFNTKNTGQSNGSFPQAVGIVGTADNTSIQDVYCEDGASAVTFGSNTGKTFIKRIRSKNMTDNGVYGLGGDNYVDEFIYEGIEEAYVCAGVSGNHTIGTITTIGSCIGALELGAANNVHVGSIYMTDDGTGETCSKAVLTRSVATTINSLHIGTIKGHIQGGNGIINMDSATTEYLQIDKIDLILDYDSTNMPTLNAWFDLTGVKQYNVGPAKIRIRDVDDTIASTTTFSCIFPVPIRESTVENFDVYFETSTGAYLSDGNCRVGTPSQFLQIKGAIWQTSSGPFAREALYLGGATRDSSAGTPSGGYWRVGQMLWDADTTSASPFARKCTVTGTPGTWIALNAP